MRTNPPRRIPSVRIAHATCDPSAHCAQCADLLGESPMPSSHARILALLALAITATPVGAQVNLLTHANVLTMDGARPRAQAMAFDAGGKILALGEDETLAQQFPDA